MPKQQPPPYNSQNAIPTVAAVEGFHCTQNKCTLKSNSLCALSSTVKEDDLLYTSPPKVMNFSFNECIWSGLQFAVTCFCGFTCRASIHIFFLRATDHNCTPSWLCYQSVRLQYKILQAKYIRMENVCMCSRSSMQIWFTLTVWTMDPSHISY